MKSNLRKPLIGLVLFTIALYVYPIEKLVFTDTQVTKSFFVEEYYVKTSSDEFDFNVFLDYMDNKGWQENESKRMSGLNVFKKMVKQKR